MAKRRNLIRNTWDYFRGSWEGDDEKFSYRRFAQYLVMAMIMYLVYTGQSQGQYGFYTFVTLVVLWSVIVAIITVQQLLIFMRYYTSRDKVLDKYIIDNEEDTTSIPPDLLANPDGVQRPLEHPLDETKRREKEGAGDQTLGEGQKPGSDASEGQCERPNPIQGFHNRQD